MGPSVNTHACQSADCSRRRHGYAVIACLSPEECATALDKFWGFIEGQGHGVRRDAPETWTDEAWSQSIPPTHAEPLWYVRGVPAVADAWAGLLGTDELLVSFCGAPLNRNWAHNEAWRGGGGSFHVDRGAYYHPQLGVRIPYGLDDRDYIQGTVTLIDNGPWTGGNLVFPKSHKYYRHIAETYHRPMKDQHGYISSGSSLPIAMQAEPELFGSPIMAKLMAGDAFVWGEHDLLRLLAHALLATACDCSCDCSGVSTTACAHDCSRWVVISHRWLRVQTTG